MAKTTAYRSVAAAVAAAQKIANRTGKAVRVLVANPHFGYTWTKGRTGTTTKEHGPFPTRVRALRAVAEHGRKAKRRGARMTSAATYKSPGPGEPGFYHDEVRRYERPGSGWYKAKNPKRRRRNPWQVWKPRHRTGEPMFLTHAPRGSMGEPDWSLERHKGRMFYNFAEAKEAASRWGQSIGTPSFVTDAAASIRNPRKAKRKRNPAGPLKEIARAGSLDGTAANFRTVLASKLTQYDVRESVKHPNIYRLGLLLEALQRADARMTADDWKRSDAATLTKYQHAMRREFTPGFPPVKAVEKQIAAWLATGKPPSLTR